MILDIIGQVFWFGIFATPIIAFLCVRKWESGLTSKIVGAIAIMIILASVFHFLSMGILLRNGLGPS